jgi:hypothetical protein
MEYMYAAMLLHSAGKDISEDAVTNTLTAAGVSADSSRVKALCAAQLSRKLLKRSQRKRNLKRKRTYRDSALSSVKLPLFSFKYSNQFLVLMSLILKQISSDSFVLPLPKEGGEHYWVHDEGLRSHDAPRISLNYLQTRLRWSN